MAVAKLPILPRLAAVLADDVTARFSGCASSFFSLVAAVVLLGEGWGHYHPSNYMLGSVVPILCGVVGLYNGATLKLGDSKNLIRDSASSDPVRDFYPTHEMYLH